MATDTKVGIYLFYAEDLFPAGLVHYRWDPDLMGTKTKRQTKYKQYTQIPRKPGDYEIFSHVSVA